MRPSCSDARRGRQRRNPPHLCLFTPAFGETVPSSEPPVRACGYSLRTSAPGCGFDVRGVRPCCRRIRRSFRWAYEWARFMPASGMPVNALNKGRCGIAAPGRRLPMQRGLQRPSACTRGRMVRQRLDLAVSGCGIDRHGRVEPMRNMFAFCNNPLGLLRYPQERCILLLPYLSVMQGTYYA